jgi:5-dehydro-2-deoxygluconokinase
MNFERLRLNSFLVMGRAGMDLYADPPGTRTENAQKFTAALGGSAANIAAGIGRLGGSASLITAVSDDSVGRYVINELKRYNIDSKNVRRVGGEARNSLAVVETRAANCQSVIYRNGAADFEISPDDIMSIDMSGFAALVMTGTSLAKEPSREAAFAAIDRAKVAGMPIALDIDYRPYSWGSALEAAETYKRAAGLSDIVVGNDDEFRVMAGEEGMSYARKLSETSAAIVIYKMGERGSVTFHDGIAFETGIYPVTALKPTGAGDAFMAGFLTSLSTGHEINLAVQRGSAAAAIVVTRVGCAPASPALRELEDFMAITPINRT